MNTATTSIGKELYLRIIVQSNSRDAHFLDQRIEAFLVQYREQILAKMTVEELQTNITACVEHLREKPKNLNEEAERLWEEVDSGLYLFQRKEMKAAYLSTVTGGKNGTGLGLEEVVTFFDQYFSAKSASRIKFCSEFYGQGQKYPSTTTLNQVVITEPAVFKRSMALKPILSVNLSGHCTVTSTSSSTAVGE